MQSKVLVMEDANKTPAEDHEVIISNDQKPRMKNTEESSNVIIAVAKAVVHKVGVMKLPGDQLKGRGDLIIYLVVVLVMVSTLSITLALYSREEHSTITTIHSSTNTTHPPMTSPETTIHSTTNPALTTPGNLSATTNWQLLLYSPYTNQLLELPSFSPSNCRVEPFPVANLWYPVSVQTEQGNPMVCGGWHDSRRVASSFCYSLSFPGGKWKEEPEPLQGRDKAASSKDSRGWMITGGFDTGSKSILSSTEFLQDGSWQPGPPLPTELQGHCQVSSGDQTVVIGNIHYV